MTSWQLRNAIKTLKSGGVIAYPTESVFGLGCDPYNLSAVSKILSIKSRSHNKGLILLVSDIRQALPLIKPLTKKQVAQINQKDKRATTWLLNKASTTSPLLSGTHKKLAIRVTTNPVAKRLCQAFGKPIVSTSCNLNTKPTSTKVSNIRNKMGLKVDKIISGSCCQQPPSRIIDLETQIILRN